MLNKQNSHVNGRKGQIFSIWKNSFFSNVYIWLKKLAKKRIKNKYWFFRVLWQVLLATFFIGWLTTGIGPYQIYKRTITAFESKPVATFYFYGSTATTSNLELANDSGWWNVDNAVGSPDLADTGEYSEFNNDNSSIFLGGHSGLIISQFKNKDELINKKNIQFEHTVSFPPASVNQDEISKIIGHKINEIEVFDNSQLIATTVPIIASPTPSSFLVDIVEFYEIATDTLGEIEIVEPEIASSIETNSNNVSILNKIRPLFLLIKEKLKVFTVQAQEVFRKSWLSSVNKDEVLGARIKISLGVKTRTLFFDENTESPGINAEEEIGITDNDLDVIKTREQIDTISASSGRETSSEITPSSSLDIIITPRPEYLPDDNGEENTIVKIDEGDIEIVEPDDLADTEIEIIVIEPASEIEIIKEEIKIEPIKDEIIVPSINENIEAVEEKTKPLSWLRKIWHKSVNAQPDNAKLVIWYAWNEIDNSSNHSFWRKLDTIYGDQLSNALNNGYFEIPFDLFKTSSDIRRLKIKIESADGSDALIYIDSVWLEADFEIINATDDNEIEDDILADRLLLDEEVIDFKYTDENNNENLIIKTNKKDYFGLGETKVYFNITNTGLDTEDVNVQVYFPNDRGNVVKLERLQYGAPIVKKVPIFAPRNFVCSSSWMMLSASSSQADFNCSETREIRKCDSRSDSGTVCLVNKNLERTEKRLTRRIERKKVYLKQGEIKNKWQSLKRILGLSPKRKPVPDDFTIKQNTAESGFLINAGETAYFQMEIKYPVNSKGEFYIEAIGDGQGYGLLDPWWDSLWQYKKKIIIDNTTSSSTLDNYQMRVEIASTSNNFWSHIESDGASVRFVNSGETAELDYYELYFNYASSTAVYWVKVDTIPADSTSFIYIYYSSSSASSTSDAEDTFSYATATPRFAALGDFNPNNGAVAITFFDDNYFGLGGFYDSDWDTGNTENTKSISSSYIGDGAVATSTKPFAITGDVGAGDMWSPLSWQSELFITTFPRDDANLYFYNPQTATATITLYRNGTYDTDFELGPENYIEQTSLTYAANDHWRATATEAIIIFQAGGGTGNNRDNSPVPPPANTWHGIVRNTRVICTEDSTNITLYFSDNTTETKAGGCSANEVWTITKTGPGTGQAPSAILRADKPVYAVSYADGGGYELQAWYSEEDLDLEYLIPEDYVYLACSAPYDNTTISVYNMSGTQQATSGDLGNNSENYPHHFRDNNTRTGGMKIIATNPVYCYYDQTPGTDGTDEFNAANIVLNRKGAWPQPSISSTSAEIEADNPRLTQNYYRWYANENNKEIGIVLAEQVAFKSTTDTVNFTNLVTASSTYFSASSTYLIYVTAGFAGNLETITTDFEIRYGSDVQYTGFVEAPGSIYDSFQVAWFDVYTQPATAEDISLHFRTNSGESYGLNAQILAINLSDLNSSDWEYASSTTQSQHTDSMAEKATITLDSANGLKDWLVLAMEEVQIDSTSVGYQGEIYDGINPYMGYRMEGEDLDELLPYVLHRAFADVAQNTEFSLRAQDSATGINDHVKSRILAINLNAFASHKTHYADVNTGISTTTWTEVSNLNSGGNYTPATDGDQIIFASFIDDADYYDSGMDFRLLVNSTTTPVDWDWSVTVDSNKTVHDSSDESFNNVISRITMPLAGYPISLEAISRNGDNQIADEVSLVVFSTALNSLSGSVELTPNNPWPLTGYDIFENIEITATTTPVSPGDILRLRMTLLGSRADNPAGSASFKLQYGAGENCSIISAWNDVGQIGSSTIWRGCNNSSLSDGFAITTTTLSVSDVGGSYEEENNSTSMPNAITVGEDGEWDWVIENNGAVASTTYCFRMIESDGTTLFSYDRYPKLITNSRTNAPAPSKLFDNEKINDVTPDFEFSAVDNESDDLIYEISWSTDYDFLTSSTTKSSDNDSGFTNIFSGSDTSPFNSGDTIRFTVQSGDSLSNNTTYWWRVRTYDPNGANIWSDWSVNRSFTVDTGVAISTWFQTTDEQFQTDTYDIGLETNGSGQVVMSSNVGEYGTSTVTGEASTTVILQNIYNNPIVVATARYNSGPARTVRITKKASSSFDVMVDDYADSLGSTVTEIDWLVMEEGVWTIDDGGTGLKVIASTSLVSAIGGNAGSASWDSPEVINFSPSFDSAPVVLHSIASMNDTDWITSHVDDGSIYNGDPTASQMGLILNHSKTPNTSHSAENIDFIAFDAGSGTNNSVDFNFLINGDTIAGFLQSPPYNTSYGSAFSSAPEVELSAQHGEDGGDGGWSIYYGVRASSTSTNYPAAIDEANSITDRAHTPEPIGIVAFDSGGPGLIELYTVSDQVFTGTAVNYDDGENSAGWNEVFWTDTETHGQILYQVEYYTGSAWIPVPDINIPGNSSGLGISPIDISSLNVITYNRLRLKASFSYSGGSPLLSDWGLKWKEPIIFSGTVYSDEGNTEVLTEPTVNLVIAGQSVATATASSIDGSFSFSYGGWLAGGSSTVVYLEEVPDSWYSPSWPYRKQITVNANKVVSNETDFPVLATTTDSDLSSNAREDGYDILFTASDGITKLNYEREYYASTTGELVAWIKTNISSTTNTVLYMYYGNSSAGDQATTTGVWDNDYAGVWHLDESPANNGTHYDSTKNANDGIFYDANSNSDTSATGKIDGADDFYNDADYIDTGLSRDLSGNGDFTAEVWIKYSGSESYALSQTHTVGYSSDWFFPYGASIFWMRGTTLGNTNTINDDGWHHVAMVWNNANTTYEGFIDGNSIGVSGIVAGYSGINSVKIAARGDGASTFFSGAIDEVRISTTSRSSDWIKTSYNNQSDTGSFMSFSSSESYSSMNYTAFAGGVVYNKYSGSGHVTDMDIYEKRIIVRHDNSGPITNGDINIFDADQDSSIKTRVNGANLEASSTHMLYVWPGDEFRPGGSVIINANASSSLPGGDIKIASSAVFNAEANSVTVGGDWINLGTFTKSSGQTITFIGNDDGFVINPGNSNFEDIVFNSASGEWNIIASSTIDNDLTLTSGTLVGTSSLTVSGGDASGNGALNLTGGVFTLDGAGNFGGDSDWNFYSLAFGNGVVGETTTKTGTGNINISDTLKINTDHSLNASSSIWTLAGSSTPFVLDGSLISSASLFKFTSQENINIPAAVYYRLELIPAGAGSPVYALGSGALTTNDYLYIGNGTVAVTVTASSGDPTIDVNSDFKIFANAGFIAPSSNDFNVGGSWDNKGVFSHNNGSVVFDAASTGHTVEAGISSFYDISFNNSAGGWTISESATSTNNWSIINVASFEVDSLPWYSSSWPYRKQITVNANKVVSNETDFPVLATTTDSDLSSNAREDGYDILFTASDGITKLNHEREHYASTTGELVAWIKTNISSTTDTVLYMYYGNSGASDQSTTTGVWDDDYSGVWHLNEDGTGTRYESASNGKNLTPNNYDNDEAISGKIGGADDFDGSNDILVGPSSNDITGDNLQTITFSVWVKHSNAADTGYIASLKRSSTNSTLLSLDAGDGGVGGNLGFLTRHNDDSAHSWLNTNGGYNDGKWHYLTAVVNGLSRIIYVDGENKNSDSNGMQSVTGNTATFTVGAYALGSNFFLGAVDEVRVSTVSRTSDWIKTEYNNQNDVASFTSKGSEYAYTNLKTIEVNGVFTNNAASSSTSWDNTALYLNSSISNSYTINSSTTQDTYGTLKIGPLTQIRMWNSSSTVYNVDPAGSLYSMDHSNQNGDLYIWGNYSRNSGVDYWSYATDFDGVDLGGGDERAVSVYFSNYASSTFSGADLQIIGSALATTTITSQSSGIYSLSLNNGNLNANYYQIRDIDASGLNLSGLLSIASLNNGDFILEREGGAMITVASTTIDANSAKSISGCYFATSTGITSGYNVVLSGTAGSYWQFINYFGNYAGEDYDSDYGGVCGGIRWEDSECTDIALKHYRWRNDDGDESGATWKEAEDTGIEDQDKNENLRLRFSVDNQDLGSTGNINYGIQIAGLNNYETCTSVPAINFVDISTSTDGSPSVIIATSTWFSDEATTSARLTSEGSFKEGYMVESPSNTSSSTDLASGEYTEIEYNIKFTQFAQSNNNYCLRLQQNGTDMASYDRIARLKMIGITVSGNAYENENSDIWGGCDSVTENISLVVNGAFFASTSCDTVSGLYSFSNVDFNAEDALNVFFNENGGNTDKGVAVTIAANNYSDITLNPVKERVWLKTEIGAVNITNTSLAYCHPGILFACRNVPYFIDSGNFSASSTIRLIIADGIYEPNGTVSLASGAASTSPGGDIIIKNGATLAIEGNNLVIGGNFINQGIFSRDLSQTTSFTATSSGFSIYPNAYNFANVIFNGSGGGWSFTDSVGISGDLTVSAGTLTGTSSIIVNGGDVVGDGSIILTGGTFTIDGTGSFGGGADWNFYNLEFGDGLWVANTAKTGTGTISVSNILTIQNNQTLYASSSTWVLSGGSVPLHINGSFESQDSLFKFISTANASIWAADYNKLELSPSAVGNPTYTILTGNLSTTDYFQIGDGVNAVIATAGTNNPNLDINGDLEIKDKAVFTAPSSGNFTIAGDWMDKGVFTHNSGTVVFDSAATGTIITASSSFYKVDFNNFFGGWIIPRSITAVDDFSLTNAAEFIASSSHDWYLSGWLKRKKITIDANEVTENLDNFPVVISTIDADIASSAQENGNDILFTAADGITKLNHEIEKFSTTTGELVAWVKLLNLSSTTDTVLFVYYDNSGASNQENAAGVWSNDFDAVWHLKETPAGTSDEILDSTGNGYDGTTYTMDSADQISAQVDGGLDFDGTSDYVALDMYYGTANTIAGLTTCVWFNTSFIGGSYNDNWSFLDFDRSEYFNFYLRGDNGALEFATTRNIIQDDFTANTLGLNDGTWHYGCAVYDGTNKYIYLDGNLDGTNTSPAHGAGSLGSGAVRYAFIGDGSEATTFNGSRNDIWYEGSLDELQYAETVKSFGWIKTSFNNQSSSTIFIKSIGSEDSYVPGAHVVFEVQGEFLNSLSAASTTWDGSTLYLNGTDQTINTKDSDGDIYHILEINASTDVKMWNSSAVTYSVNSSGSLYSMDHAAADGELYVWGAYTRTSGVEYWSRSVDFDGTDLSGGSERQCKIYFADNAEANIQSSGQEIIGSFSEHTILDAQSGGNYSLLVSSSTIEADYFNINNADINGLRLTGSTTVISLDHGTWAVDTDSGSGITVDASTLNSSGNLTISGANFSLGSGIATGTNVSLSGSPVAFWVFTGHSGSLDGEDYDVDPGDSRGYIVWDDSPDYTPKSQDWHWYYDEEKETPTEGAAATNTAPSIVGFNNTLKLRLTISETEGLSGEDVKMRLQYSTYSDFSSDVNFVGEIGSTTALWTYGNGFDNDNDFLDFSLLADANASSTHNESGISTSSYDHAANMPTEWEFTLYVNEPASSTIYYFRAFSSYFSLYDWRTKEVVINTGESYPSIVVSGGYLSLSLSGFSVGSSTEGIITDITSTATEIPFGQLTVDSEIEAAQRFSITTDSEYGYQLFVYSRQQLLSENGADIDSVPAFNENPNSWPLDPSPGAFGYHAGDDTLSGASPSRFAPDNTYVQFETEMKEIGYSSIPVEDEVVDLIYKIEITNLQEAGDYETEVVYILVPTF